MTEMHLPTTNLIIHISSLLTPTPEVTLPFGKQRERAQMAASLDAVFGSQILLT